MKRIALYIIIFIGLLVSCTQNNGNIGPLFGKWQLREIQTEDNLTAYDSIFYNFQSNIVQLQHLNPYHGIISFPPLTGFFTHTADELVLDIRNCDTWYIQRYFYLPDTTVVFNIEELSNKKMNLRLDDGTVYRFRKFGPN